MINETELDTLLEDPEIIAFALVGRPAKPGDTLTHEIDEAQKRVNIADIYLFTQGGGMVLHTEQLALPVGVRKEERRSAKPILSTERKNIVSVAP